MKIEELAKSLDNFGLLYMATIGLDGNPKVRPMQYMITFEDKLWFCTNSKKSIYKELEKNPFIDICASTLMKNEIESSWLRMSAKVIFEENVTVKKMIMQKNKIVHELYKNDAKNPIFKVFYIADIKGSLNNLGHVKGLEEKSEFFKPVEFEL